MCFVQAKANELGNELLSLLVTFHSNSIFLVVLIILLEILVIYSILFHFTLTVGILILGRHLLRCKGDI